MMKDFKNRCSVCSSSDLKKIFELPNYPAYIVPVPLEISKSIARGNLPLYSCLTCGHMQTPDPDPGLQRLIYEEYYSYYTVDSSETFIPHYRKPFIDFCEDLFRKGFLKGKETILEIGCSSGQQVNYFRKFAKTYIGIDPSERIKIAMKNHPDISFVQGYFPQDISGYHFDVIVSQFNLEHIGDVVAFLATIHDTLDNDGIVLLQVPDIEDFRRNKQPNFMAHEHIQYFTKNSLEKLLRSQGFDILGFGVEGPSLIVAGRKIARPQNFDFSVETERALTNASVHVELFNNFPTDLPKEVIFYGVGPQLYWLLSFQINNIRNCAIFDDNPTYTNKGLPGYCNKIQKPSVEVLEKYKTVVLSLNRFYHPVVLEKLKALNTEIVVHHIDAEGNWNTIQIEKS